MRALILIFLGACALVGCAIGLESLGWVAPANYFSTNVSVHTNSWFPLINLRHNAFLHWRLDAAIVSLFGILPVHELKGGVTLSSLVVLFAGLSLLFLRVTKHRAPAAAVFSCFLSCLALLCIFGWDTVLFQSFAWLPFFILCLIACLHGREAFGLFFALALFFSLRIAKSANELAPLVVILGLSAAAFLFYIMLQSSTEGVEESRASASANSRFLKILALLAVSCLMVSAMPVFDAPSPNGQDYPWQAHVVDEDWISGNVHPLIGPGPAIPFIDRQMLKRYAGPLSLGLLLVVLFLQLKVLRRSSLLARYAGNAALGGLLACSLDTLLPETLAYISPVAVFSRLIPGSFLFPLADVGLALSILSISLALCAARKMRLQIIICAALIIVPKTLLQSGLTRLHHDFGAPLSNETGKFVVSPSFPVIDALGMWVLQERERVQRTRFMPSPSIPMKVLASHSKPGNEPSKMFDQDRTTRWSAGRAFQSGDEWLYLKFDSAQNLSAVELAPSFFKSDFPAALRISSVDACPDDVTRPQDLGAARHMLIEYNPWQGSLDYTDKNFPFYTAQKRVRAFFPKITSTQCLLVEQVGKNAHVDWSVAEIRLGFEERADVGTPQEDLDEKN